MRLVRAAAGQRENGLLNGAAFELPEYLFSKVPEYAYIFRVRSSCGVLMEDQVFGDGSDSGDDI